MPVWLRDPDGRLIWVNKAYVKAVEADSEPRYWSARSNCWKRASAHARRAPSPRGDSYRARVHLHHRRRAQAARHRRHARRRDARPAPPSTSLPSKRRTASSTARSRPTTGRSTASQPPSRSSTATRSSSSSTRPTPSCGSSIADWLRNAARPTAPCSTACARSDVCRRSSTTREWKAKVLACYARHARREDRWHLPDGRIVHVHCRAAPGRRRHLSLRRRDRALGAREPL